MLLLLRLNPNRRRVIHVTSGVLGLRPRPPLFVSPAYRAQLALYKAALGQVFPGKTVRCALLWTDGPRLMPVPDELLALP